MTDVSGLHPLQLSLVIVVGFVVVYIFVFILLLLQVGRSPEIALAKSLREKLEQFADEPKAKKLQDDIFDGKYDQYNDPKIEKKLRENLALYQVKGNEISQEGRDNTFRLLKFKQSL